MKGAELLVRCLRNEDVRVLFGVPGEETLGLLDALLDSGIQFVTCRHEQGAAFMADVWGRLSGRAGVCLGTLGPGATNLATGLGDANLDRAPVVAITGQAGRDRIHKESHQYVNVVDMFRSITKWNTRLEITSVIPEAVRKAFKVAEAEKPGVCHLELPEDVADEEVSTTSAPLSTERPRRPSPDRPALRRAAELIDRAKNPLIFAGNGVIRGKASLALREFAGRTGVPVANTFMAKGCLPWDHELALGTIGLQMRDVVSCGFDRADLVVAVGYDPVEFAPKLWNGEREKTIVHIDFTPAEVDEDYQPAVEVVADIREALDLLTDLVSTRRDPTRTRQLHDWILGELHAGAADNGFPMKPQRVLHDLRKVLAPHDILISDVGAHKLWVARLFQAEEPNTVIISNGFAAMGIALPGAVAAKLLQPERRVVAVVGDGGFLMNVQELETAVRLNLNVVVLIFRDDAYGVIRWKQLTRYGRESGVAFGNPDFVALARAFGCRGERVEAADELLPALETGFGGQGPCLVEVPVDYRENLKLAERMGQLVCPI
ncbi:MAG TPA: acetolactate synthase large subunit [Methylomirabilota bacterium]|jgi:acetolactate synthase-1/2/3 large subunit|nr:acetolactate synthase large subunit [Methylomirabilota bacterium]